MVDVYVLSRGIPKQPEPTNYSRQPDIRGHSPNEKGRPKRDGLLYSFRKPK